jgi:hypothetical protein
LQSWTCSMPYAALHTRQRGALPSTGPKRRL